MSRQELYIIRIAEGLARLELLESKRHLEALGCRVKKIFLCKDTLLNVCVDRWIVFYYDMFHLEGCEQECDKYDDKGDAATHVRFYLSLPAHIPLRHLLAKYVQILYENTHSSTLY